MDLPDQFSEATEDTLIHILPSGKWILLVTTSDSEEFEHLANLLNGDRMSEVLENFECFYAPADSDLCAHYAGENPAGLYVLVGSEDPYREYLIDDIDQITEDDIIQFLDDTAAFILEENEED